MIILINDPPVYCTLHGALLAECDLTGYKDSIKVESSLDTNSVRDGTCEWYYE